MLCLYVGAYEDGKKWADSIKVPHDKVPVDGASGRPMVCYGVGGQTCLTPPLASERVLCCHSS